MTWQVGDWCFCHFKLQMVKEMREGRIVTVSDGSFELGASDLTNDCFPLSLRGKQVTDAFDYHYRRLHTELNDGRYNFPDFNRHAISEWRKCMEDYDKFDEGAERFAIWCDSVIEQASCLHEMNVGGIPLFRR